MWPIQSGMNEWRDASAVACMRMDPDIRPAWLFGADLSRFPHTMPPIFFASPPYRASRRTVSAGRFAASVPPGLLFAAMWGAMPVPMQPR